LKFKYQNLKSQINPKFKYSKLLTLLNPLLRWSSKGRKKAGVIFDFENCNLFGAYNFGFWI